MLKVCPPSSSQPSSLLSLLSRLAYIRSERIKAVGHDMYIRREADMQRPLHYIVNMISLDLELGHYQVYPNKMVS